MSDKTMRAEVTEHGHWISQNVLAYEVRMTSKKPDEKWRQNHIIMAIAGTIDEAMAMCKRQYPDPIVTQVVLRNRGMDLVLSREILLSDTCPILEGK